MNLNYIIVLVFAVICIAMIGAAIALPAYLMRKAKGVESDKKVKTKSKLPDDEHKGREAVVRQLARYAASHEYKVVEPISLTGVHGTTDLDAVLVGWFGILGVKCLGYSGDIYGSLDEQDWVQSLNGTRRSFQNPMTRAQQSSRVIRDVLFEAGMKNIPVESIVVFTGKSSQLMLPRSTGHYTEKTFSNYLKSIHFEEDKNVQVEPVAALLREKSL